MKDFANKLLAISNGIIFLIVLFLLGVIYFKNNRIIRLKAELEEKPQIEYIEKITIDTFIDEIPVPVEIVKWYPKEVEKWDTLYAPISLTGKDSAQIAEIYLSLYSDYASIKKYDDILRDDSLASIRLKENVQYNTIFDRELIYEHRTPVVKITTTKQDRMVSVIGGVEGNFDALKIGAGVVTKRNAVYLFKYDPFNDIKEAGVYLPVFNFKK